MTEPTRAASHVLEEKSRLAFRQIVNDAGWVAVDMVPDYGEDLLVFAYEDGQTTGSLFFVQLKASSVAPGDAESYPCSLKRATLRRWKRLPIPVVLVAYVEATGDCFWLILDAAESAAAR